MKRFGLLALACLMTLAFTAQLDAGFRVRPVSDESPGKEHDENEGGGGEHQNPKVDMIRHLMKKFDRNRDGGLSYREAPKWLKKKFSEVDSNRDGKIDAKELMEMLDDNKPEDEERTDHPPKHPRPSDKTPPPLY